MADQKHQGGGRPGRLSGERCEECGAAGLRVRDSKRRPDNMRRLRVECSDCGHRYSLLEVAGSTPERPGARVVGKPERSARGIRVSWEGGASAGVLSPIVFIDGWRVQVPYVIRWMEPPEAYRPNWYAQGWCGGLSEEISIEAGGAVDIAVTSAINSKLRELRDLHAKPDSPRQPFRPSSRASTSASE